MNSSQEEILRLNKFMYHGRIDEEDIQPIIKDRFSTLSRGMGGKNKTVGECVRDPLELPNKKSEVMKRAEELKIALERDWIRGHRPQKIS